MNLQQYQQFTHDLTTSAAADGRVLGLVAMGSMAQQDTQPDAWSDHDFFLIVVPGTEEAFKNDLSWLPQAEEIALAFRETEHGMKVLYRHGHLLEFAIFHPAELANGKANRYQVLLDRADITADMARMARETTAAARAHAPSDLSLLGQFLANLLVGAGRYARGEQISGRQFITGYALNHLLRLLARHLPAEERPLLDNLDPYRRFERVFPDQGRALNRMLQLPPLPAALALLTFAAAELTPTIPDYPVEAAAVVREMIERAAAEQPEPPA